MIPTKKRKNTFACDNQTKKATINNASGDHDDKDSKDDNDDNESKDDNDNSNPGFHKLVDALKVFVEETFHSIVKRVEYIFKREEVDMMEWVRDHVQGLIDDRDHVHLGEEYVNAMILLYDRVFSTYHLVDYDPFIKVDMFESSNQREVRMRNKVAHEALIHIMSKWTAYVTLLYTCDEKLDSVVDEIHKAMKEINAAPHSLGVIEEDITTGETAPIDHIFSSDLYFDLKVLLLENPTSKALYEVERIPPYHSHVFNFPSPNRFNRFHTDKSKHTYEFCPPKFDQHVTVSSVDASVGDEELEFYCVGMRQDEPHGDMILCFKGPETRSPRNPWIEVLISPMFVSATGCYNFSEELPKEASQNEFRPFSKNTSILLAERCGKNYTVTCPGDAAFKMTFHMEIYELNNE